MGFGKKGAAIWQKNQQAGEFVEMIYQLTD
jgi:hypothetical protein